MFLKLKIASEYFTLNPYLTPVMIPVLSEEKRGASAQWLLNLFCGSCVLLEISAVCNKEVYLSGKHMRKREYCCLWHCPGRSSSVIVTKPVSSTAVFEMLGDRDGNAKRRHCHLLRCATKLGAAAGIPEDIWRSLNRLD